MLDNLPFLSYNLAYLQDRNYWVGSEKEYGMSHSILLIRDRVSTGPTPPLTWHIPAIRGAWLLGSLLAFIDCGYLADLCSYTLVLMLPTSPDEASLWCMLSPSCYSFWWFQGRWFHFIIILWCFDLVICWSKRMTFAIQSEWITKSFAK